MIGSTLQNRYRLDAELGRGGMGIVYRAYDTLLGRSVAVKLLSATGLGSEGRVRLLNEAQAVARLNHPNVVLVYDAGQVQAQAGSGRDTETPFIVMELVEGKPLREYGIPPLQETLALARQICGALEHAHSHGIIHRDLKPENVVITSGHTVKLMDFGLARATGTARITAEGAITGTFSYMAPEILLGQAATPRSDLYALGVMLYELTTGRPPFEGETLVAVISQHLNAPVVPPSTHNPTIPVALDALIVRLLGKRPEERPASAAEVNRLLDQLESAPENLVAALADVSPLERITRGRLIGREDELAEVNNWWRRVISGEGQTLLISGEPGIGKTRFVREIMAQAELSGGNVLIGECYAEGGPPYAPFSQMIRTAFSLPVSARLDLPDFVMADLITLVPDLRARFPHVPPNPPLEPQAEQQRLFESTVMLLTTLAGRAPLLVFADDVHWADGGSLFLLRYLARRARKLRLMLVMTYREVELDEARDLNEVLLDLNRERLATRIKLLRFDKEQTRHLLASMFDDDISDEFLYAIYRETEGNPFFIEEVCKSLIEEEKIYREDGRWRRRNIAEMNIPQSIRVTIQSRLAKLPEATQETLRLAAVIGREFDFATLKKASDLDEDSLIDALENAERAQLISEARRAASESFIFAHALIPSTLRDSISGLRRHRLHRRVAAAIEVIRSADYETLAYHYAHVGDEERACGYYIQAADRARSLYSNHDAIRFYSEALTLVQEDDSRRFDLLASRAAVYDLVAWRKEQFEDAQAMIAIAERDGNLARLCDALLVLADHYVATDSSRTWDPARRAVEVARAIGDRLREGRALRRLGWVAWAWRQLSEARRSLEASTAIFEEINQPAEAAITKHILSLVLGRQGLHDLEASRRVAEEALALSRQVGDKRQEANSQRRLAILLIAEKEFAKALQLAETALQVHRDLGDRLEESNALNVMGIILSRLERREEAERYFRQAVEVGEAIGTSWVVWNAIGNWMDMWMGRHEYENALEFLDNLVVEVGIRDPSLLAQVRERRAFILTDLGQFAAALEIAESLQENAVEYLGPASAINHATLIGRCLTELGQYSAAHQRLEETLVLAQQSNLPGTTSHVHYELSNLALREGSAVEPPDHALLQRGLELVSGVVQGHRESENHFALVYALNRAADLHLALEQHEAALAYTTESLQLVETMADFDFWLERLLYSHVRALRAHGRHDEAADALQQAYEKVMETADKMKSEQFCKGWLEGVPANRAILAEWQKKT
jgi:predicted ATPase